MTSLFGTCGMAPKKLSESDKQEILDRYCHSDETTVTLAAQYGVSTSTISRILKQSLPEQEYESLVQRKRQGAFRSQPDQEMLPGLLSSESAEAESPDLDLLEDEPRSFSKPKRRQPKRSAAGLISAEQLAASAAHLSQLDLAPSVKKIADLRVEPELSAPIQAAVDIVPTEEFVDLEEDDLEEDLDDLEELDDDLDDLEELDDDEFDEAALADDFASLDSMQLQKPGQIQILPLAEAPIPRTCYVVVDRSSELITRPLKDFAELGQVPTPETHEKTLPIFDNHRVAKRFLRRMQRIVKVPDGRVFQKVQPYLQAKGITHLLIDGQVYSLS
jgi:transposase-like protein